MRIELKLGMRKIKQVCVKEIPRKFGGFKGKWKQVLTYEEWYFFQFELCLYFYDLDKF